MCFSEQVSFGTAAVLTFMGFICLKHTRGEKRYYPLALIPFFFAIQQAAEGFQWLAFKDIWQAPWSGDQARMVYLMFAYTFWPFWLPFSLWLIEKPGRRRQALAFVFCIGSIITAYNGWMLLHLPTKAVAMENSIQYTLVAPKVQIIAYVLAVITPWFISSLRNAWVMGVIYAISVPVASYFYYDFFVSVWCFFAAFITIFLIITLRDRDVRT